MFVNVVLSKILILFLFLSCGKNIEESDKKTPDRRDRKPPPTLRLDKYILKQNLSCTDPLLCPENIGKIIVRDGEETKFCVGTLIESNKVMTSSSCLPRSLRIPELDCTNKIFAIFPKTNYQPENRVGCKKIISVDENSYKEPALWKNDLAVFEIYNSVERPLVILSQEGIDQRDEMLAWKINMADEFNATLENETCSLVFNTYLNPFSKHEFSPMLVANNCKFDKGHVGAPLFSNGQVVGIYSESINKRMQNYLKGSGLLSEKLSGFHHFSNIACRTFNEKTYFGSTPEECNLKTSVKALDTLRSNMLKNKKIHLFNMRAYENSIEVPERYFWWDFEIAGKLGAFSYEAKPVKPKCIYRADDWIGEFRGWRGIYNYGQRSYEYPHYIFKTKLDRNLHPISVIEDGGTRSFVFEFNPFSAFVNKVTYVSITPYINGKPVLDPDGKPSTITYENIQTQCPDQIYN